MTWTANEANSRASRDTMLDGLQPDIPYLDDSTLLRSAWSAAGIDFGPCT